MGIILSKSVFFNIFFLHLCYNFNKSDTMYYFVHKIFILSFILIFFYKIGISQDTTKILDFGLSYKADLARNFGGGIKKGNTYMGLITGELIINTKKIN